MTSGMDRQDVLCLMPSDRSPMTPKWVKLELKFNVSMIHRNMLCCCSSQVVFMQISIHPLTSYWVWVARTVAYADLLLPKPAPPRPLGECGYIPRPVVSSLQCKPGSGFWH